MVMEAVSIKASEEDKKAQKEAERDRETAEWKRDHGDLEQFRDAAGATE